MTGADVELLKAMKITLPDGPEPGTWRATHQFQGREISYRTGADGLGNPVVVMKPEDLALMRQTNAALDEARQQWRTRYIVAAIAAGVLGWAAAFLIIREVLRWMP